MSPFHLDYLRHILDETGYLIKRSAGLSKEEFLQDETLKRAFVRSIEVIGEAVKKVPADFKDKYPLLEWRAIAGMRDKLIHDYFGVDYDIVWDVVTNKVPELNQEIKQILDSEASE
jgi:uncharacterized protein with HEPN domain